MVYIILKLLSYTFSLSMKKINGIFTSGTQQCWHKVVDFHELSVSPYCRWDHSYEQCSRVTLSVHSWFSNITRAVGTTGNHSSLLSVCTACDSNLHKVGHVRDTELECNVTAFFLWGSVDNISGIIYDNYAFVKYSDMYCIKS